MCSECARNQGARFPIGASRRAPVGTTGVALREEKPLLLDPCDPQDAPEAHLTYLDDGRIASETERGQVTIEVFGLNRASLLAARPLADERVRAEWAVVRLWRGRRSDADRTGRGAPRVRRAPPPEASGAG